LHVPPHPEKQRHGPTVVGYPLMNLIEASSNAPLLAITEMTNRARHIAKDGRDGFRRR
jgi:hypothetical protein